MAKKKKHQADSKKKMVRVRGIMRWSVCVLAVVAVVFLSRMAYRFGYAVFDQEPMTSEVRAQEEQVIIQEGMTVYQIGKTLERKGLIEDPLIFWVQEEISDYRGQIKAGTYTLTTAMTPDEMLRIMSAEEEEESEG